MKRLAALVVAIGLTEAMVTAQTDSRAHTRPLVPTREALAPLNLKLGWRTYLPVDGTRDGIATVQVFGSRILVQLRSGTIVAVDADTGQTLWKTRVGNPYQATHGLAVNYNSVIGYDVASVFALDKDSGKLLWHSELPNAPSGAPAVDADHLYVPVSGNHVLSYILPAKGGDEPGDRKDPKKEPSDKDVAAENDPRKAGYITPKQRPEASRPAFAVGGRGDQFQLPVHWDYTTTSRIEYAPLLVPKADKHPGFVLMGASDGVVSVSYKEPHDIVYTLKSERSIVAPMGQTGSVAYIPTKDNTVIALDIETGKVMWRFSVGGPILYRPEATDEDVYIAATRYGLSRVKRATGDLAWPRANAEAERFLAASKKWVYALDRTNNLLVLDRSKGTRQAKLDMRGYTVAVGNDQTDRIFLGANDGLLICLHERDSLLPLWHKKIGEEKPEAPKAKVGEPKLKPMEPKMEKKDDKMEKKE